MNNLLASLGLNAVEADPNTIPDGNYDAEVQKSELAVFPNKGTLNHVITYKVIAGDRKGAQKQEVFTLGKDLKDAQGQPTTDLKDVVAYTPSMSDSQKPWYKKRLVDLGIPEPVVDANQWNPEDLVGIQVTFGVKKNDQGYQNINFVQKRDGQANAPQPVNVAAALGASTPDPAQATVAQPTAAAPAAPASLGQLI